MIQEVVQVVFDVSAMPVLPPYDAERNVLLYGVVIHHLNIQAVIADAINNHQQRIPNLDVQRQPIRRRRRRWWTRLWILRRPLLGQYERLVQELRDEDLDGFRNFMRMDPDMYAEIAERVSPRLYKPNSRYRPSLEPGLKLTLALRYFAAGNDYKSLMYAFRVGKTTIVNLIPEVADAIIAEYGEEVIPMPTTPDEWKAVADLFQSRWNLPHCVGALDGKHVRIQCPAKSGSLYYNYKKFFSIILFALCDADYKFLWTEIGCNGIACDAQVFNQCELKELILNGNINFPDPEPFPGDNRDMPYYIAGDDAFPLKTWLMKPFSQRGLDARCRTFNYRLSRGRRVVENAFGILANRFQVLLGRMRQNPKVVCKIILACICLHNLMRVRYPQANNHLVDRDDRLHNVIPGQWRDDIPLGDLEAQGGNPESRLARNQRLYMSHYFMSDVGAVDWQARMIENM